MKNKNEGKEGIDAHTHRLLEEYSRAQLNRQMAYQQATAEAIEAHMNELNKTMRTDPAQRYICALEQLVQAHETLIQTQGKYRQVRDSYYCTPGMKQP